MTFKYWMWASRYAFSMLTCGKPISRNLVPVSSIWQYVSLKEKPFHIFRSARASRLRRRNIVTGQESVRPPRQLGGPFPKTISKSRSDLAKDIPRSEVCHSCLYFYLIKYQNISPVSAFIFYYVHKESHPRLQGSWTNTIGRDHKKIKVLNWTQQAHIGTEGIS